MAASYPAGFDTMSDPAANLSGPPLHSTMHNQINDVIEAIEAELGLSPSGADATVAATLAALPTRYGPAWLDWTTANGAATDMIVAVISSGGGNWGTTPPKDGRFRFTTTKIEAKLKITSGATAGMSAGSMDLTLPKSCRFTSGAPLQLGTGAYMNAAGTIFAPFMVEATSTTKARLVYPATHLGVFTAVSNTVPFAFGVGVVLWLDLSYEPL